MPVVEQSDDVTSCVGRVGVSHRCGKLAVVGSVDVECEQLTDRELEVGTLWRGVTRILGKRFDWITEFIEYQPAKMTASKSVEGKIGFTATTRLEEVDPTVRSGRPAVAPGPPTHVHEEVRERPENDQTHNPRKSLHRYLPTTSGTEPFGVPVNVRASSNVTTPRA